MAKFDGVKYYQAEFALKTWADASKIWENNPVSPLGCVISLNETQHTGTTLSKEGNKSGVKRLNTLGHLDQYMAQHGRIVKHSYCETI